MFCFLDIDKFDYCTLKCDPEKIEELLEYDGFQRPFNLSRKHWIAVGLNGNVSEKMLKDLIENSYKLVAGALPKKKEVK